MDLESGKKASLKDEFRSMHGEIIGTTKSGKSEIVQQIINQDVKNRSGVLIIDGKSEATFIHQLYAHVKRHRREKDFRLFSLAHVGPSSTFNPLRGETAQEVTERVFSSFKFENEYFRSVQYKAFMGIIRLIFAQKQVPTFALVHRLLVDMEQLAVWVQACPDENLKRDMTKYMKQSERERGMKKSAALIRL